MMTRNLTLVLGVLVLVLVSLPQTSSAEEFCNFDGCAEFPGGEASFADVAMAYMPTAGLHPLVMESHEALGPPDNDFNASVACLQFIDCNFTTLGHGGSIVFQFVDNVLTGSGDAAIDLFVFETGPITQGMSVEISANGTDWEAVGDISGDVDGVDIDLFGFGPGDLFRFVRLTDDNIIEGEEIEDESSVIAGADIDAVGAISSFPNALGIQQSMLSGNSTLAVYRASSIVVELRNALTGVFSGALSFFGDGFTPIDFVSLGDADNNGVEEVAVLATRDSDGRAVVEIRNVSGDPGTRQIWFASGFTPLALDVVPDADSNNVPEIAVLSIRDSDGRGVVEIKNASGATAPVSIWAAPGVTPAYLAVLDDADGNAIPDVVIASTRDSDGRILAEVKNASGATMPNTVWFMPDTTLEDFSVIPGDADNNGTPELVALLTRNSDGRILAEVKNAAGAPATNVVWFSPDHTFLSMAVIDDADGNSIPEIAVLTSRNSDGRALVRVSNAAGAPSSSYLWQFAGNTPVSVAALGDTDTNGIEEAAVLLSRQSDGRMLVEVRNASGAQSPRQVFLLP